MNNVASRSYLLLPMTIVVLLFAAGSANAQQPGAPLHLPSAQDTLSRILKGYTVKANIRNPIVIHPPIVKMPTAQCAVPLLPVQVDAKKEFAVRQITPRITNPSIVVKPSVPACAEKR